MHMHVHRARPAAPRRAADADKQSPGRSARLKRATTLAEPTTAPVRVPDRVRSAPPAKADKLVAASPNLPSPSTLSSGTFLLRPSVSEDGPSGQQYAALGAREHQFTRQKSGLDLSNPPSLPVQIRLIGATGVGKSTFLRSVTDVDALLSSDATTFVVEECLCKVRFSELPIEDAAELDEGGLDWDDADSDAPVHGRGTVVLYDVMEQESLKKVPPILNALRAANEPAVLVATKCDNPPAARHVQPGQVLTRARNLIPDIESFETALYAQASPGLAVRSLLSKIIAQRLHRTAPGEPQIDTPTSSISPARTLQASPSSETVPSTSDLTRRTLDQLAMASAPGTASSHPTPSVDLQASPTGVPRGEDKRFPHTFLFLDEPPTPGTDVPKTMPAGGQVDSLKEGPVVFEELVERLLRPVPDEDDHDFVFTFLAFYRNFASPSKLLGAIVSHFGSVQQNRILPWEHETTFERDLNIIDLWITQYPGDFAKPVTRKKLQEFLDRIDPRSSSKDKETDGEYRGRPSEEEEASFLAAAQQIRVALQSVVEDEDTDWACSDRGTMHRSRSSTFLSISSIDSLGPDGSLPISRKDPAQSARNHATYDNKIIFGGQATVTLSAMGRGISTDGMSTSTSLSPTLLNVAESANRQASLLTPQPKRRLDKESWRAFLYIPDEVIAREFTRIDWILFSAIRPRDMIRNVTKLPKSTGPASPTSSGNSHENVNRMIDHFNHLAYWVTNMVLFRDKPKHRAQMLEKLMRVARCLRSQNNYYSLSAFIAAILSPPVSRLGLTKDLVDADVQKRFASLTVLMATSRSHWAYRFALETTEKQGLPRIPFLPLHRRDLLVIESAGKTFIKTEQPHDESGAELKMAELPAHQIGSPPTPSTPNTPTRQSSNGTAAISRDSSTTFGSSTSFGSPKTAITSATSSVSHQSLGGTNLSFPLPPQEAPKINWPKFATLGSTMRILQRAQACPYTGLAASEEVKRALLEVRIWKDDDVLYEQSCALETAGQQWEGGNAGVKKRMERGLERLKSR